MHSLRKKQKAFKSVQEQESKATLMKEDDKQDLIQHLKRKWGILNATYQKLPLQMDTPSKKRSKEELERELSQCEADIHLLQSRPQVIIMH